MTAQMGKGTLKCVVEEDANGKKYCITHSYELEPVWVSEMALMEKPNPVTNRAWRCPKGGTLIEIFNCRSCGQPVEARIRPASAGRQTVGGEEYGPVKCPCGGTYQSSEVGTMLPN